MNNFFTANVSEADPLISGAIDDEVRRQTDGLELIASENFVSEAVLQAMGTAFTNKYAEGYPGKRYYGGCEHVDVVETLAIARAKELFGADHANVLALGARLTPPDLAKRIVNVFLDTPFGGGRHQQRVDKISGLENRGADEVFRSNQLQTLCLAVNFVFDRVRDLDVRVGKRALHR